MILLWQAGADPSLFDGQGGAGEPGKAASLLLPVLLFRLLLVALGMTIRAERDA